MRGGHAVLALGCFVHRSVRPHPKHVADRLQIGEARLGIGLEVAALGPLVPGVERQDRVRLARAHPGPKPLDGAAKLVRRIAPQRAHERIPARFETVALHRARRGVPAHRDVREKRQRREARLRLVTVAQVGLERVAVVHRRKRLHGEVVDPHVRSDTVETKFPDQLGRDVRSPLTLQNTVLPKNQIEVGIAAAGRDRPRAKRTQRLRRGVEAAQAGHELVEFVEREIGPPADAPVVGQGAVDAQDDASDWYPSSRWRYCHFDY